MQQNDYEEFTAMLDAVSDLYGKSKSEWVTTIWWNALSNYDLQAIRQALSRHARNPDTGQFMPKPADVVRMLHGTTQDAALNAWAKVDRAVRSVGTYRDVVFDDPIIHRVIADMGGWVNLGTKKEDDWPFVAKEFENRYRGFCTRREIPEYLPVMTGIASLQNAKNGFKSQPPVLIGDNQSAEQVMLCGSDSAILPMQELKNSIKNLKLDNG